MDNPKTDDLVNAMLREYNKKLAEHFKSDVVIIKSPIRFGLDDMIRHCIENLPNGKKPRPERLTVLLETTGGYIEVVERIYGIFRNHYRLVDFIVPNYAYSAGTVLVLSGDDIYMDYYSVLGPIDPQVEGDNGFVPGLGYLQKYKELLATINGAKKSEDARAELAYLISKFHPATLFLLEQAKAHSESLLEEWLSRHKFKDWKRRHTSKKPVSTPYKRRRAKEIAQIIGDPERWHSHGRGIGLKELTSEAIKLQIRDFGKDAELNGKIRRYYDMFVDYSRKVGAGSPTATVLHSASGLRRV